MDKAILHWESRIGRRLKLRDLHILSAVVQWGSMAKAASHLAMSQPAVSEAIANLEDALRVRLLDRSSRGIEPTIYAHALVKRGPVVFDELRPGIRAIELVATPAAGEVRVEFWQHPLAMHASAENAAVAALAAHQQGKFWEYHDEVFRNQNAIDPDSLARYAAQVGLDVDRFKTDYASPELRARAKSEAAFAERFGAQSTPAFMINGNVKMGWGSWNGFRGDVERELNEARKLEVQGVPIDQIASQRAQTLIQNPELLQAYREQVLRPAPEPVKDEGKHKDKKNKKDKKGKN